MKQLMKRNENTIEEVFKDFIYAKRVDERKSIDTIKLYQCHIGRFVARVGADTLASEITKDDYLSFMVDLGDRVKNERTQASYHRSVRAFLYWAMDEGHISPFKIRTFKVQESVKIPYSDEEVAALLKKPSLKASFVEHRTWLYCCICLSTGLRLGSVLNIQVKDVNLSLRVIAVRKSKNKQAFQCPISQELAECIKRYITRYQLIDSDYLICNQQGNELAKKSAQDALKRYNHNRGVKATSSHLFRHTYAVNFMKNGGDIMSLKEHLQHQTIQTTQEYLRSLGVRLFETVDVYNPLKTNRKIG